MLLIFIIKESQIKSRELNVTNEEYLEFTKSYILNYKISKQQKEELSLSTVGQSSNQNWFLHRIGRITGSVAHRVFARRDTTDPSSLLNEIMGTLGIFKNIYSVFKFCFKMGDVFRAVVCQNLLS